MAYKYTKRELAALETERLQLAAHFTVGNIIFSDYWRSYDRVITFEPSTEHKGWSVTVRQCNAQGQFLDSESVRTHYTFPDKRDKIIGNVLV